MKKLYLGVDIGGTKIAYGVFDHNGSLIIRREYPSDVKAGPDALFAPITDGLKEEGVDFSCVCGVGIGAPSAIDYQNTRIISTVNLPHLSDIPLKEFFSAFFPNAEIRAENDANAAALAEHRRGAGRDMQDMVYISVSTGVGGGIIHDGKIIHGKNGYAGEIGHMLLRPGEGPLCGCGHRGCFESLCAGKYIGERAYEYSKKYGHTLMKELAGQDLLRATGHTLYAAYSAGDDLAKEMLSHMSRDLGILTYNLFRTLDVDGFVFGGGLIMPDWPLFDGIYAQFCELNKEGFDADIRRAELGSDVGIIGAFESLF